MDNNNELEERNENTYHLDFSCDLTKDQYEQINNAIKSALESKSKPDQERQEGCKETRRKTGTATRKEMVFDIEHPNNPPTIRTIHCTFYEVSVKCPDVSYKYNEEECS